ncbi:hypothetical protein HN709_00240 [Candidatus Peregrinibacteria bacterium]|jgi:hypothetical protein|nr:hypothetical protein [Candidatus Peregrinibacteria bacterium]MBT7736099.1 hypothetical protein [Candidatus Peregrinibacteria bacterium]
MSKDLYIEFGAQDGGYTQYFCAIPVVQAAEELQEDLRRNFGDRVNLVLIPYEGDPGVLGGGRQSNLTTRSFEENVPIFNQAGMPFMLAMNGGVGLPPDAEIDLNDGRFESERMILDCMAESGEKHGVRNMVTVIHDNLIEALQEKYPFDVVSSCVGFTGGKKGLFRGKQSYDKAFELADAVCPTNQHTTPGFLREWIRYAHKMVLLLNSHCASADMHKCFTHYQMLDAPVLFHILGIDTENKGEVEREDFEGIHNPEFPYTPGCTELKHGQLWHRPEQIEEFMRWGVNKFKLGRYPFGDPLNPSVTRNFVRTFLENSPDRQA